MNCPKCKSTDIFEINNLRFCNQCDWDNMPQLNSGSVIPSPGDIIEISINTYTEFMESLNILDDLSMSNILYPDTQFQYMGVTYKVNPHL